VLCWLQILICQNLRNNLQHPNEYIRGVTLRFLCRIREEEILEPLVPSILANLEHRCGADARIAGMICLASLAAAGSMAAWLQAAWLQAAWRERTEQQ
jgi:vesicle coat complex subunit